MHVEVAAQTVMRGHGAVILCAFGAYLCWRMLRAKQKATEPYTILAVLGSGGHTAELLAMMRTLPRHVYTERVFVASTGDTHSMDRVRALERPLAQHPLQGLVIPRARAVGQSWWTTPLSVTWSLLFCVWYFGIAPLVAWMRHGMRLPFADVLLMNGPATCLPIALVVWVVRLAGCPAPKMVYIESFARVQSLSLTGKMLRHMVDTFIVQWPSADPAAECYGVLV